MKVLVVGGGAAGLMAAGAALRQGHEGTGLEHMEKPAQKILVTGKGRCNVTNDCTAEEFLHHVRTNPRFLFSSLGAFPPAKTMELFESLGVELKVERGRRVFPVSDKAEEIRQALLRYADGADIVHDGAKKLLLEPLVVELSAEEKTALLSNLELLESAGLEIDDFGGNSVFLRSVPADVEQGSAEDLLVELAAVLHDPVTTTDELIPSGETSSYRSNPERLSEFALSRRDPQYVSRSKVMRQIERDREAGKALPEEVLNVYAALTKAGVKNDPAHTDIGSTIFANMPGDGSAREQAASCQRVMGASANFAKQYATKRYRSNCINWGMTPFLVENPEVFELGDYIFVPGIREAVLENKASFTAYAVKPDGTVTAFPVSTGALTEPERQIIADGCLINYYRNNQ